MFGIVPKSLRRIEQGAEADLEMSSGLTGSSRAVSMKMYWRPCKAVRSNPFSTVGRRVSWNSTEVTVSLGVLIYPKDEAFRRSLYLRIKQFALQESSMEPIGSLDHRLR